MTDQDRDSLLDQTLVTLFKPFSQLGFYLGCVSSFSHLIPDQVPYTPLLIFKSWYAFNKNPVMSL